MKHIHAKAKHYFDIFKTYSGVRKVIAIGCITWGVFAFFTPFTPGSLLVVVGFVMLYGKEETSRIAKKYLGEHRYKQWNLAKFFEEKEKVTDI